MIKDVKDEKRRLMTSNDARKKCSIVFFRHFTTKIVVGFEIKNQNIINRHKITKNTRGVILIINRQAWCVMAFDVKWRYLRSKKRQTSFDGILHSSNGVVWCNLSSFCVKWRQTKSFNVKSAWREHKYNLINT